MLNMPVSKIKEKIVAQSELSASDVEERVQDKMKQLAGLISEEGAYHIIANELDVELIPSEDERTVSDLSPGMRDVTQALRVVQAYELHTFESKYGDGEGKVCSFLGGDESGVIRVTCWGEHAETASELSADDVVRVKNGYVKDNDGRAELHLNNKSELEVNPDGVDVDAPERTGGGGGEYERKKVRDLSKGDSRVEILGTVVQVYDPNYFEKKDGSGQGAVLNVLLDDGTGNIRCACWNETAAKALGISYEQLLENQDSGFDEEKTELLGRIVKAQGRSKLNEVYNTIEMNVDNFEIDPDAEDELDDASDEGAAEPEEAEKTADEAPAEPEEETDEDGSADEDDEDVMDLDDLEDLDDVDLDDVDVDHL